jgi:predicted RNA binding protein YcfA (HicA-like mRNA interferase family)
VPQASNGSGGPGSGPTDGGHKLIFYLAKQGDLMRIRDAIKLIEAGGWYLARTKGSHRQFRHLFKSGLVTIAGHPNKELHPKTLKSILKQAGIMEIEDD